MNTYEDEIPEPLLPPGLTEDDSDDSDNILLPPGMDDGVHVEVIPGE